MKLTPLLFAATFGVALMANAGGVKDKKRWDQATIEVNSVKVEAESACGVTFEFSFDRLTFEEGTDLSQLDTQGMNGYCGDAFAAMADLCEDDDYRAAMASISSVSCAFDKNATEPDANVEEGHLRFTFNWNTANHRRTVREYLENSL